MFLKNAISLLLADVFFHPVWLHFPVTDSAEAARLTSIFEREVKRLSRRGLWLDSCRAAMICASLQNFRGSPQSALETLRVAQNTAQRHSLMQVELWTNWGASAICAQEGGYSQSADYLRRLEQDLYQASQWVLANLIGLVRQVMLDRYEDGEQGSQQPLTYGQDEVGFLIEQMQHWGSPFLGGDEETASLWYAAIDVGQHNGSAAEARGIRELWQKVRRFIRGELRIRLVEARAIIRPVVEKPAPCDDNNHLPASDTPLLPSSLPGSDSARPQTDLVEVPSPAPLPGPFMIPITGLISAEGLPSPPSHVNEHKPSLAVYCMGTFKVFLNNQIIHGWNGQKGTAILKYLVANRDRPVAKDILMDLFWPDSEAEVARRNLHQAIYGLRQTIRRALPDLQLILFENDCYRISTDVELWMDFEEFERFVLVGRRKAEAGAAGEAVEAFGMAELLYAGDFMEEELYESWPQPQRQYFRSLYLEIAAQISAYYIQKRQTTPAMILCQKVLARDHCNERAYRDLMLCHMIQGQRQLSIREYQVCVQVLKDELGLPPSEEIQALYRQIIAG